MRLFQKLLLCLAIFALPLVLRAQHLEHQNYDWEKAPALHQISPADNAFPEVVLMEKQSIEYAFDQEGSLSEYYLIHRVIKVNSDEAIESNNKIYLPLYNIEEVLINKARVITSDGQIKEVGPDDIKQATDEENKESYLYFAIEGVDIGSEIEYIHYLKVIPNYAGKRLVLQGAVPKRNVEVEIISPKDFIFSSKSLNAFPEMALDTNIAEKNRLHATTSEIGGATEELFSVYEPNLMQIHYKLDKNSSYGEESIFTYTALSKKVHDFIYEPINKKTEKEFKKLTKEIKIHKKDSDHEQIRKVEDYLKENYQILEMNIEGMSNLEFILEKRYTNKAGMAKLFANLMRYMKIDHEMVLTCNRHEQRFDPDFESYGFLETYLIYFPKLKEYVAPTSLTARLGFVPYQWTHNYGLHIKSVELGGLQMGVGYVRFINAVAYEKNVDQLKVNVNFTENFEGQNLEITRQLEGYYAQFYQPLYDFLQEEEKQQVNEHLIRHVAEDAEISSIEITNEGTKDFARKPLVAKSKAVSKSCIERAGNKYLFKVGTLIGLQTEMYREQDRNFAVENDYNRKYIREISFVIPDGYKVSNLEAIDRDIYFEKDGKRTMAFTASHEVNGNTVTIKIHEYYKNINYPIAQYEDYRRVINAAADFNKLVVFFEKADETSATQKSQR